MKLLFLANRTPYPPYRGDKLKIYNLARRLAERHELHLLTFAETAADEQYKAELEKIFRKVHLIPLPKWRSALQCFSAAWDRKPLQVLYFQSEAMKRQLSQWLTTEQYDAVHVQHLRMAPYLADRPDIPRILDLPDAFSLYWERRKAVPRGALQRMFESVEQGRVLRYEPVLKQYDLSLACSGEDIAYLEKETGAHNIRLLPNGVDLDTFYQRGHDYSHNHTMLFTGNMDYAPNVDAVLYFTKEILPLIRQRFPQVQFVIAGQRPVAKVLALAGDGVTVTGFVEDMAAQYNEASVVVAPLRFGAGTQNKVLEAMAMGIPVVCSHIGFEGLGIASGEGAFMQREVSGFGGSVCALLESAALRETTGAKGAAVIRERFGWDAIAAKLEEYFYSIVKG